MAPKTIWIHNFIESAEPSTKLKKAPTKTVWIHNFIESAEPSTKLKKAPKPIWIHNCIEAAEPTNLIQAPKLIWIHKYIVNTDLLIELKMVPNALNTLLFWIHGQITSSDQK